MTNEQTLLLYLFSIASTGFLVKILSGSSFYQQSIIFNIKYRQYRWEYTYNRSWLLLVAAMPLIILAGIRYDTGADYTQYCWNFARAITSSDKMTFIIQSREPLYSISELIVYEIFGDNVHAWFFLMALITISCIYIAVEKIDRSMDFSIFSILFGLYIYLHMFNYVRQFLALGIVLLGLAYCLDKKYIRFIVLVIIASYIHQSSLIFCTFLIIVLKKRYICGKMYHLIMLIAPMFSSMLLFLLKRIPYFSIYVTRYFNRSLNIGVGFLIDILPVIILYYLNFDVDSESNKRGRFFSELSWMIIPIRALAYYSYAAGRLFINFSLFSIIGFACLVNHGSFARIKKAIAIIVLLGYFMFSFYLSNSSSVFPYSTFF